MAELKKIFNYLTGKGLTQAGAAGLMGNMQAESGCIPNKVEILCLKRLKENGKTYTDKTYTAAVDSGKITRAEFLNPLSGKQYGYGLCQWTSPDRKAGLYDLAKKKGVSIGDLTMQLDFLMSELSASYKAVLNVLKTTSDVQEASDIVLTKFEIPANADIMKKARGQAAYKIYTAYKSISTASKTTSSVVQSNSAAIQKVIDIAKGETGYLEKKSASSLDDKTANAGSANYTKYWRDVYPSFQGQAWCACFVSWCFMQAFGKDTAKKMLKHWPFVYCPTLANMTTNKTPKVGSIILFYKNGTYAHTGIVTGVGDIQITTIEGNTSGGSRVISNGGGVCQKTYTISALSSKTKYFMPDYSLAGGSNVSGASSARTATAAKNKAVTATGTAAKFDRKIAGTYICTAKLNIRNGASTKQKKLATLPEGTEVKNYGYYSVDAAGAKWLYIQVIYKGVTYTGFCCGDYLRKKS